MEEKSSLASLKKDMLGAAIVKESDMPPDMMSDIQDTVVTCIEGNFTPIFQIDNACKAIKEILEKRYGPVWQVIIGEGYAYDVTVQNNTRLFMFYNGNLACLVFKS